jgi:hypothetical protein
VHDPSAAAGVEDRESMLSGFHGEDFRIVVL